MGMFTIYGNFFSFCVVSHDGGMSAAMNESGENESGLYVYYLDIMLILVLYEKCLCTSHSNVQLFSYYFCVISCLVHLRLAFHILKVFFFFLLLPLFFSRSDMLRTIFFLVLLPHTPVSCHLFIYLLCLSLSLFLSRRLPISRLCSTVEFIVSLLFSLLNVKICSHTTQIIIFELIRFFLNNISDFRCLFAHTVEAEKKCVDFPE